ncbi:YicC-like family, N-terminal region [Fusobacterium necrogenes]|uniref:YicC-like family, N-terminal region n=1 Tax=Fusobacterium necrogenes TaxID=858 RepID=A0A377GYP0_9FUSO|nr:YicC/YloC family endoribonuclease [Fusobacterium necrogenes]STO32099.1 YicC-like family, N-terminal region [Fusobacterium necrogenes]
MRSMTGYSKLAYQDEKFALNMELKSVNNKNLNLRIKLPYSLNFLEGAIRTEIASKISRGSLDLKIEFSDLRDLGKLFDYDKEQSKQYMSVLLEMEKDFNEKFSNKMDILVRNLDVIKKNDFEINENEYTNFILKKIEELLIPFIQTREEEGERLKFYLLERLEVLEVNIEEIKKYKDIVVETYKNKLLERLDKVKTSIEFKEEDILKEILLFTDKSDISEELSRLDSHLEQLKKEISIKGIPVGKKIDFILQEIYRELNTTGVKSNLYEISKLIVESKNELEKIREQSMNIE